MKVLRRTDNFVFAPEPGVPAEMQEGLKPEELVQMDAGRGLFGDVEKFQWTFENRDALNVGSTMVGKNSSMALLRAAADFLGISKGGSKFTLWTRLNQAVQQLENQRLFQDANRLYREQEQHPGLQLQAQPRQPTQEERLLHMNILTSPLEAGVSGVSLLLLPPLFPPSLLVCPPIVGSTALTGNAGLRSPLRSLHGFPFGASSSIVGE